MYEPQGAATETVTDSDFARAVRTGLAQPQKVIPARFFYDHAGSELFEAITALPEYYPTRTEIGILTDCAPAIAAAVGPGRAVVEFGSGSSTKTPLLLAALAPSAYVPVDISADFLAEAADVLAAQFPGLAVTPVAGDFTRPLALPDLPGGRLGFFPGSTLGNLAPAAAIDLLNSFGETLGLGSWLVIGLDLVKDVGVLEAAYDDAQGVTAAFNRNLLTRINRELGGTIDPAAFRHRAPWNPRESRIEMHLEAMRDTSFRAAGMEFRMAAGETIHTENSHKYTLPETRLLARAAGWTPHRVWTDPEGWFSVQLWARDAGRMEP